MYEGNRIGAVSSKSQIKKKIRFAKQASPAASIGAKGV